MNLKDIDLNKLDEYIIQAKKRIEEQKKLLSKEDIQKVNDIVDGVDLKDADSMSEFLNNK